MEAAVEAEALVKRYGDRAAVKEASFTIRRGEIFALLGPNGAGKTTTVEMLEGFRRPDAGRVRVLGRDPWSERRHLAPRVGVMPQEGALHAGIKPREAVRLFAAFYPNPADPAKLLEDVGLGPVASTPYRRLSGGEKQRLSLALALAGSPRVLFLDEPTAHMDPRGRADTWELIGSYRDRGTTVLLTTHLLDEAERLADRVAVIHHGEIVAVDTPQRVAASKDGDQVRFRVASPINPGALGDVLGAPVELVTGGEYVVRAVGDTPSFVARLTAFLASHDVSLWELRVGGRSLEEAFLELTAERGEER